jgi:hypothetical protein
MNPRAILIEDIDVDPQWNSRGPGNVANGSFERSGIAGLMANLRLVGQITSVDVRKTAKPFYRDTGAKPYSLVTWFRRIEALSRLFATKDAVPNLPFAHIRDPPCFPPCCRGAA